MNFIDPCGFKEVESVSLFTIFEKGVPFVDIMWLFSLKGAVFNEEYMTECFINKNSGSNFRDTIIIDISSYDPSVRYSILKQPYPDCFRVVVDNIKKIVEIKFFKNTVHLDRYTFQLDVVVGDRSLTDVVVMERVGDEENFVFYGKTTWYEKRFYSFNGEIFNIFKRMFLIGNGLREQEIDALAICSHAFANAVYAPVYFNDLSAGDFLNSCVMKACIYLRDYRFIVNNDSLLNRINMLKEFNRFKINTQWLDARLVSEDDEFKENVLSVWEGFFEYGDVYDKFIATIAIMRFKGVKNDDIFEKIKNMSIKYGVDGIDAIKKLSLSKNTDGKTIPYVIKTKVKKVADENILPCPPLDRRS